MVSTIRLFEFRAIFCLRILNFANFLKSGNFIRVNKRLREIQTREQLKPFSMVAKTSKNKIINHTFRNLLQWSSAYSYITANDPFIQVS